MPTGGMTGDEKKDSGRVGKRVAPRGGGGHDDKVTADRGQGCRLTVVVRAGQTGDVDSRQRRC
jgi:hypothetical protein